MKISLSTHFYTILNQGEKFNLLLYISLVSLTCLSQIFVTFDKNYLRFFVITITIVARADIFNFNK